MNILLEMFSSFLSIRRKWNADVDQIRPGDTHNAPDSKVHGANIGTNRTQVGPMKAPWNLISGVYTWYYNVNVMITCRVIRFLLFFRDINYIWIPWGCFRYLGNMEIRINTFSTDKGIRNWNYKFLAVLVLQLMANSLSSLGMARTF